MEEKISKVSTVEIMRLMPNPPQPGTLSATNDSLKSRMDDLENSIFNMRVDLAGNEKSNWQSNSEDVSQEYNSQFYFDLERGKFPKQSHLESAIGRALNELVSKPLESKNPIEQRLDDLFLEYLPPRFKGPGGQATTVR